VISRGTDLNPYFKNLIRSIVCSRHPLIFEFGPGFFTFHAKHSTRVEVKARGKEEEEVMFHVHVSSEGFDCQVRWAERDLGAKAR
jgi:hypothetical protein